MTNSIEQEIHETLDVGEFSSLLRVEGVSGAIFYFGTTSYHLWFLGAEGREELSGRKCTDDVTISLSHPRGPAVLMNGNVIVDAVSRIERMPTRAAA
jgi:hypothetical protein